MKRHDVHAGRLRPRPRPAAAPVYPARLGTGTRALAPAADAVLASACVGQQACAVAGRASFEERRDSMKNSERMEFPDILAWVNQEKPLRPETFNGLSAANWQYIMDLQEEADSLRTICLFLGGLLVLFTIVAVVMYQAGWIIH